MIVRGATFDDVDAIIALGKQGHARGENARYAFDDSAARLLVAQCLSTKRLCAFVAEEDGIVGVLLGQEEQYPYIKMRFATDIALYTERAGAGVALLARFEQWALQERKVDRLLLGVSFDPERAAGMQRLYRRQGFKHVGGIFTKDRT